MTSWNSSSYGRLGASFIDLNPIFTEMAHWADSISKLQCAYVMCCVSVPLGKPHLPVNWRLLSKRVSLIFWRPLDIFRFCCFNNFLHFLIFHVFGSLQTSLLYIMGELALGGSMAVGVCDRWQVTGDSCPRHVPLSVFFCLFWYQCYYPYTSRDSVSPVCGIFLILFLFIFFGWGA